MKLNIFILGSLSLCWAASSKAADATKAAAEAKDHSTRVAVQADSRKPAEALESPCALTAANLQKFYGDLSSASLFKSPLRMGAAGTAVEWFGYLKGTLVFEEDYFNGYVSCRAIGERIGQLKVLASISRESEADSMSKADKKMIDKAYSAMSELKGVCNETFSDLDALDPVANFPFPKTKFQSGRAIYVAAKKLETALEDAERESRMNPEKEIAPGVCVLTQAKFEEIAKDYLHTHIPYRLDSVKSAYGADQKRNAMLAAKKPPQPADYSSTCMELNRLAGTWSALNIANEIAGRKADTFIEAKVDTKKQFKQVKDAEKFCGFFWKSESDKKKLTSAIDQLIVDGKRFSDHP